TKFSAEPQSTWPAAIIETAGFCPDETNSVSIRAPSLANCFAILLSIGDTRLVAAESTRKRSCGSGCGKATADCTTSSTNLRRESALESAAGLCWDFADVDFTTDAFCLRDGAVVWALADETLIAHDNTRKDWRE